MLTAVAILRRRLREEKSYEDFGQAWFHEEGFNAPNRMLTMLNVADPREVIVIGITQVESVEDGARLIGIDQSQRSETPLDAIIESDVDRTFAILVAEDDFSAEGSLQYHPATTNGEPTDMDNVRVGLEAAKILLGTYLSHDRDT